MFARVYVFGRMRAHAVQLALLLLAGVVDTFPSPQCRPGWCEAFIVCVRCMQLFNFRLSYSIDRTHSGALEVRYLRSTRLLN